jgi:hypothetical protein
MYKVKLPPELIEKRDEICLLANVEAALDEDKFDALTAEELLTFVNTRLKERGLPPFDTYGECRRAFLRCHDKLATDAAVRVDDMTEQEKKELLERFNGHVH